MKNLIYFLIIFLFAFSCKKMENVKKEAPEMIGYWSHLSENNGFHYIYIQNNGRGYLYGQNNHGNNQDTQRRGWYIDNDTIVCPPNCIAIECRWAVESFCEKAWNENIKSNIKIKCFMSVAIYSSKNLRQ